MNHLASKFGQYMFWDALTKVLDQKLLRMNDVSLELDETYKQLLCHSTRFSSCQCRRDISKVANSCLTWTARDLWQWTSSDIESRRHCLTMDGFRHRESSSLLTSGSWICFCPITLRVRLEDSRIINTTIFIGDHVWCTIENVKTKSSEHEIFLYWKPLEERNFQTERNHPNTKFFSLSGVRFRNFSCDLKFIRARIICFSSDLKLIRARNICFSFWLLHLCLTASKWFEKSLSSWFSHLTGSNWSKRLRRSSQLRQNDDCFRNLFFNDFQIKSFEQVVRIAVFLLSKRKNWNFDDIVIIVSFGTSIFTWTI